MSAYSYSCCYSYSYSSGTDLLQARSCGEIRLQRLMIRVRRTRKLVVHLTRFSLVFHLPQEGLDLCPVGVADRGRLRRSAGEGLHVVEEGALHVRKVQLRVRQYVEKENGEAAV